VGGQGNRLIEEGGRQLLDLAASFGPAILGHSHPEVAPFILW
jgi:4-aminobutyrate aminotransferase